MCRKAGGSRGRVACALRTVGELLLAKHRRDGLEKLEAFAATYECKHPCNNDLEMPAMVVRPMFKSDVNAERAR